MEGDLIQVKGIQAGNNVEPNNQPPDNGMMRVYNITILIEPCFKRNVYAVNQSVCKKKLYMDVEVLIPARYDHDKELKNGTENKNQYSCHSSTSVYG